MMIKITVAIPAYNQEKIICESIESALMQDYPNKEILVIDDNSTDMTFDTVWLKYRHNQTVRIIRNPKNIGIGKNLERLMKEARGKYVVYLCGDDNFTCTEVLSDIVNQFDRGDPAVGIISRYYYEFMNGKEGAVGVFRDRNILTSSVNPSGMAFRRDPDITGINAAFVEMPYIVKQYLKKWRWTMFEYDVVAVRIHPGGNTATKKSYYTGSYTENWKKHIGINVKYYPGFIQLKCRAPHLLWQEIKTVVKNNDYVYRDIKFWVYALTAIIVPGFILRPAAQFYRNWIGRINVQTKPRGR
jgi:glycosyltransferase involved in cell wall biosynthesis